MTKPLVSVVMAVYNSDKYLKLAIDSILNQSYENFEFLIVNDGSTDNSREIILSYTDPRLKYLENSKNSGIVFSRNRTIDESKGKYIAVIDSDDISLPFRLEKQVEFLESKPEYGMCGTFYKVIDSSGKILYKNHFPTSDNDIKAYLFFGNSFCHSTVMMRAEFAHKFKYSNHYQLCEDYYLWQELAQVTKLKNLPIYSTLYRIHNSNVSFTRQNEMFREISKINAANLNSIQIPYTEDELIIHGHFLNFNFNYFKDPAKFKNLEEWIIKLFSYLQKEKRFNKLVITNFLLRRWFIISIRTKHYNNFINLKLFLKNKIFYLRFITEKFFDSLNNVKK